MSESFPDSSKSMTRFQEACLVQIVGPMVFEGLSEREVATELGTSTTFVRQCVNELRRELKGAA